jgi:glycosyltransferase involved in cell wall biosynthesis
MCLSSHFDKIILIFNHQGDQKKEEGLPHNMKVMTLFVKQKRKIHVLKALVIILWVYIKENKKDVIILDDWFTYLSLLYPFLRLYRFIFKLKLVLVRSPVINSWMWFKANSVSIIINCSDYLVRRMKQVPGELLTNLSSDILCVQSKGLREQYIKTYRCKPVIATSNSIDINKIKFKDVFTYGPSKLKKISLIYAGNLSLHKGLDLIIKFISEHKKSQFNITIMGQHDNPRREEKIIVNNLKRLGIVVKNRKDNYQTNKILQTHDILLLPSLHEGMPRIVLEFLRLGKPVVVTDLPGLTDIETPLLFKFKKNDFEGFLRGINAATHLIQNGYTAHANYLSKFSAEYTAQTKAQLLRELIYSKYK